MADDDNFDIDIYGDDAVPEYQQENTNGEGVKQESMQDPPTEDSYDTPYQDQGDVTQDSNTDIKQEDNSVKHENDDHESLTNGHASSGTQQISSTGGSAHGQVQPPKQAPVEQGIKRKETTDDNRPTDPNATTAILISECTWWVTDDDVRGWANQCGCEDELKEITFNEHKVNGKSKGQIFVELASPQAATELKHKIESFNNAQQHGKKQIVTYHGPTNPFKTLPKDVPNRKDGGHQHHHRNTGGNYSNQVGMGGNYNNNNNFRSHGYSHNRGGMNNTNFNNRNFSGSQMGGMPGGGYGGGPMGGFAGGMGGMQFGNFNRGGMMGGMRGGMPPNRGGMGNPMMGGMGMGGMGGMGMNPMMGGIGGNMGMGMGMGMGGMQGPGGFGAGAQPHFNPAFFGQNQQGGGGDWQNPHGNKRPRPE